MHSTPSFSRHAIALAVSLLGACRLAAAEQPAPEPAAAPTPKAVPTAPALERVEVTGARADLRQLETAAKVFVLRDDLLKFGDKTLSDALKRVPGITVDGEVRMRGLGNGYTQILIDGEPAPAGFTIDSISPELIERIEILRTGVAEYSMRSIAGSINLILRKQVRRDQREIKLGVEQDDGRLTPAATLQWSGGEDAWSYQVTANASQSRPHVVTLIEDQDRDASGQLVTHRLTTEDMLTRTTVFNISPRIGWKDDTDTLAWQLFLQRTTSPADWTMRETTLTGAPSDYPSSAWSNHEARTDAVRSDLTWSRRIGEEDKLDAKLGLYRQRRDTDFGFLGDDPAGALQLDRSVVSDAIDSSVVTRGKYSAALGADHAIATGWDGSAIRRREDRLQTDRTAAGDVTYVLDQQYVAQVRQLALFAQDEWNVSKQWQAYLGVRWEGLRTRVSGRAFDTVGNHSSVFSPVAQVVWKLPDRPKDQLRLGLSRTYKAPATATLVPRRYSVNNNNGPTNSATQGNPDLRPELAWGLDAAYESYFDKSGFLGASAYARRIRDVITPTLFQDGTDWVNSLTNNGSARTWGIELEAKLPLRSLVAEAPNVTLRANVARNWSSVDNIAGPDNSLSSQTPLSANLGVDWNAGPGFSLGSSFTFKSTVKSRVTATWTTGSGPVRTLDAYALWTVSPQTSLRLAGANLLHQDRGDFDLYDGSDGTSSRTYEARTTTKVRLTLEHKF